jgi:hypothetical protein
MTCPRCHHNSVVFIETKYYLPHDILKNTFGQLFKTDTEYACMNKYCPDYCKKNDLLIKHE